MMAAGWACGRACMCGGGDGGFGMARRHHVTV
jgi:hypothetical protein